MPQTAVVVWKRLSRRSELLAKALNADLWFFPDSLPYLRAALRTFKTIISTKPKYLIVQLPQGPLLLEALFLKRILGCNVLADVHTGFLLSTNWKGKLLNTPFVKLLVFADLVIAHNDIQLNLIPKNARTKSIVVLDPWPFILTQNTNSQTTEKSYVVFPASFASDEPLREVINAINMSQVNFTVYITGNWKRKLEIKKQESPRIRFTGFLPNEEFSNLLANATGIVTGTTREYTSLMSGWEAVAYNKPLALTNTQTLKNMFHDYAIFYDYRDPQTITYAVETILNSKSHSATREKLKQRTLASIETLKLKIKN